MNAIRVSLLLATAWGSCQAVTGQQPSPTRIAAYLHLGQCIDNDLSIEAREQQIDQAIAAMRDAGVQAVVPYVSTTSGVAHYPSNFLPERRWGDWDPVARLMAAAKRNGLQVHLCVPVLACGHDQPAGILRAHPDWALRDPQGKSIGSISPGHPEARRWLVDWLSEIVERYRPDGILLDYMRYASQETQLDSVSQKRFSELDPRPDQNEKSNQIQSFREQLLTELMQQISTRLREIDPRLHLSIYSWGYHVTKDHRVGQDWPQWAARGFIDEVNVSGYWFPKTFSKRFGNSHLEAFENAIRGARRLLKESASDARLTFALGIKTSHGEVQSVEDIAEYLELAKSLEVDGTIIFTWTYLQKFLSRLVEADVLSDFAGETTQTASVRADGASLLVATKDSHPQSRWMADFIGDGVGDQEQINQAIKALPPAGGTVMLAEGTYDIRRVENSLGGVLVERSNVVLAGRGSATKLILAQDQNTNVIRIIGSAVHHVTIRDLYVDANRVNNHAGQGDPNVSHARFEFCGIKGYCRAPGGPTAKDLHDITIRNCEVRNSHRLGIMLEGRNLQVVDNILGNAGSDSVELLTGPGMIRGNYVEITGQTHVAIGSDRGNSIQMSNNTVHVRQGGKLDIGIRTWADSQRHLISGNVILIDDGGTCELAMDLRGQMQTVTGNTIHCASAEDGTKLRVGGGNTTLMGNLLKNVVVEINDTYGDNKPIKLEGNILDDSRVEHVIGNWSR